MGRVGKRAVEICEVRWSQARRAQENVELNSISDLSVEDRSKATLAAAFCRRDSDDLLSIIVYYITVV